MFSIRGFTVIIPVQEIAPHSGFGSLEDSKQSCFSLIPQPPWKDVMKMLENDGKVLRYLAHMVRECSIVTHLSADTKRPD